MESVPPNKSIFSVGAIVEVDEEIRPGKRSSGKGHGHVQSVDLEKRSVAVKYSGSNIFSPEVAEWRLHASSLGDMHDNCGNRSGRRRRLSFGEETPGSTSTSASSSASTTPVPSRASSPTRTVLGTLKKSRNWIGTEKDPHHPLCKMLFDGRKTKSTGWLRDELAAELHRPAPRKNKQLDTPERKMLSEVFTSTRSVAQSKRPKGSHPLADLSHAIGKSKQTIKDVDKKCIERKLNHGRKQRSDAGVSVLDVGEAGDRKRIQVCTPLDHCKRWRRSKRRADESGLTDLELKDDFNSLSQDQRLPFIQGAEELRGIASRSANDTGRLLRKANGAMSWCDLESQLSGDGALVVGADAIRRHVMSLPDLSCKSTVTHPLLSTSTKSLRLQWAKGCSILIRGGMMVAPKVQFLHLQSDEKWFCSLVVRTHLKHAPFFGCCPVRHAVHHKNHIGKVLVFAMTGFAPTDNNFRKGGKACKVLLNRAGGMVKAKKDQHKRVHADDGNGGLRATRPAMPENRIREKGKECFQNWEITGDDEGTEKNPKCSLVKMHRDGGLQRTDDLAAEMETTTGKRVVAIDQDDNAGPHSSAHRNFKRDKFRKRGWFVRPQPPNSPTTSVQDLGLFSALAKAVHRRQGRFHGSHCLQGEDLWNNVVAAWNGIPADTIARLHCLVGQIANAIDECDGGDEFMGTKNDLHCGVRKVCEPIYNNAGEPTGVECYKNTAVKIFDEDEKLMHCRTPDITAEFKRDGTHRIAAGREEEDEPPVDHSSDHRYVPALHLSEEELELLMDHSEPSHPDHDCFCADDEFDAEWDLWEQQRRLEAANAIE